jgi:hypothetical protein
MKTQKNMKKESESYSGLIVRSDILEMLVDLLLSISYLIGIGLIINFTLLSVILGVILVGVSIFIIYKK